MRSQFKKVTMMVDAFPCYCRGRNSVWYCGQKHRPCISCTVIFDWQGCPLAILAGQLPNLHDATKLEEMGEIVEIPHWTWEHILADGGYSNSNHCLCPWRKKNANFLKDPKFQALKINDPHTYKEAMRSAGLSYPQHRYNKDVAWHRSRTEHWFGVMKQNWSFIEGTEMERGNAANAVVFATGLEKYLRFGMRGTHPMNAYRANEAEGGRNQCGCKFARMNPHQHGAWGTTATIAGKLRGLIMPTLYDDEE